MKSRNKSTRISARRKASKVTTAQVQARERDILKGIMENSGIMMAYFDPEFNFIAVTSAYAKDSGHMVEELIGKNHFVLFPNAENQAIFEKVRDTGEAVTFFDKPFGFADQPERGITYWDWTLAPVKGEAGRVQGLILSLFETTQRKKAEDEIKVLSRFTTENPNPILRISKDGTIQYCNNAGLFMLNEWKCQVGQPAPDKWYQLVADVFESGTKNEFEEKYGTQTFSFILAPVAEAGYVNIYGSDSTERKKTEETLRQNAEALGFLSSTATKMLEPMDLPDLFKLIADRVYAVADGAIVIFNEFDARNRKVIVREFRCKTDEREKLSRILGRQPEGVTRDFLEWTRARMVPGELSLVEGGIRDLVFGQLPAALCEQIEQELKLGDSFATACALEEDILGTIAILTHERGVPSNKKLIESIVNQAALALKRRKAENELRKAHDELEARVEERTKELQAEIAERKRAEEAGKTERKRFIDVLEKLPAYLVLLTPDYHVSYANRFFRERFGEDHGRRCFEYLFGRTEPCETCETYKTLKAMLPLEWEWTDPDGRNYYIYDFPFIDTDGSTLIMEVGIDITERKKAEEKLHAASLYARSLIEASLDPLVTISSEGKITDVNKATEEVTGFSREQLIGSDFSDYFTNPEEVRKGYRQVFTEGFVRDYPLAIRHKSGKITDVLYNATVYRNEAGEIQGIFAAARDITERKQAEEALRKARDELEIRVQERTKELTEASEALRESEMDLTRAQAVAKTGSWRLDLRNNALLWSDETYRIYGIPKGTSMTYETFLGTVHPDDREFVDQKWKAALQGEPYDIEHRIIVNGEIKWIRERAELEFEKDGLLLGGFGTAQDITERKRAEQTLYQAKQEWERTFDSVPDLIAILDDQHRIVRANRAMAQQLGVANEQCIGLFCYKCVHGTNQPPQFCPHAKTLKDGQEHIEELHEDSLGGDFLVSTTPLRDEQGRMVGSVHVARNITERKKMEAKLEEYAKHLEELVEEKTRQLNDAERLAAIGQTAGMVGHDIRNPLQSIEGAAYLAKEELKSLPAESRERKELEEIIELIKNQTDYIDHIVSDLQDFAKLPLLQLRETDIQEVITESLSMFDIPNNIQVQTIFQHDLKKQLVDPAFLKRILVNLIENAIEAMPSGGEITIKAFEDKQDLWICVEDTGAGIPEENKPKIFTPLFTTKAKGQGFGLSVCRKLVETHNGEITFESEQGKGTKFKMKLPSTRKETV